MVIIYKRKFNSKLFKAVREVIIISLKIQLIAFKSVTHKLTEPPDFHLWARTTFFGLLGSAKQQIVE